MRALFFAICVLYVARGGLRAWFQVSEGLGAWFQVSEGLGARFQVSGFRFQVSCFRCPATLSP